MSDDVTSCHQMLVAQVVYQSRVTRGVSQTQSFVVWGTRGRRFKSCQPDRTRPGQSRSTWAGSFSFPSSCAPVLRVVVLSCVLSCGGVQGHGGHVGSRTVVGVLATRAILVGAIVVDLTKRRFLTLQCATNDTIEILLATSTMVRRRARPTRRMPARTPTSTSTPTRLPCSGPTGSSCCVDASTSPTPPFQLCCTNASVTVPAS